MKAQLLLNQYNTDAHEGRFEDALENSKLAVHYFERLIAGASQVLFAPHSFLFVQFFVRWLTYSGVRQMQIAKVRITWNGAWG